VALDPRFLAECDIAPFGDRVLPVPRTSVGGISGRFVAEIERSGNCVASPDSPQGPVSTAVALDEPRCHKITALIAEQLLCVRTRDRRDHSL